MSLFSSDDDGLNLSISEAAHQQQQQQHLPAHLISAGQLPMPDEDEQLAVDGSLADEADPAVLALTAAAATSSRLAFLSSTLSSAGFASLDFPTALEHASSGPLQQQQLAAIVDGIASIWSDRQRCQTQMQQVRYSSDASAARLSVVCKSQPSPLTDDVYCMFLSVDSERCRSSSQRFGVRQSALCVLEGGEGRGG